MNRNRALWIVQGVLAVLFAFAGAMKLHHPGRGAVGDVALPGGVHPLHRRL